MEEDNPGVLKQGANVALGALETYGKGVDYLNDQVSLRTLQQSTNPAIGLVNKFVNKTESEWLTNLLDYSYKDLRDDVSGGVGWAAKKVTGSETAGNVAELGTQIVLPDAVDFAAGGLPIGAVRKLKALKMFKRGSKTANNFIDTSITIKDAYKLNKIGKIINQPKLASESGAIHFVNQIDNIDDIFTKNSVAANKALSYKKLAQQYQKVSKLDMPVVKGYKAGNIKEYNKYVKSELEHWAKHGKGSGKYFVLEHATDATKNIKYRFDNKGARTLDGILSNRSFSWKDLAKKSKDNKQTAGTYRAKTKGAQITLEEYIEELGEELGRKGFELDKQRMRRLRRWIGKNVHLDHIQPISKGGFDHPANMILLYAKDNLSKNAKVLPDSFFTNMKIPKTKQELIRSSLRNPEIPNKVKREVILELLIK
mgnify:CR=1 FL=1|tara:strand:+ start:84 stop:1358 length:1275 start_codon:yes stop_codon:yes gene_type:complete